MIEVHVCRGGSIYDPPECRLDDAALNWGNPISDPLLCTNDAAIERGRVEVDKNYSNRGSASINSPSQTFIQPGSMVKVVSGSIEKNGMLTSISINYNRSSTSVSASSSIEVELNDNSV